MQKEMDIAKNNFLDKEKKLSSFATKSSDALRFFSDSEDIRPAFFRDSDRIIYSLSYTRYLDKTQVFSRNINDHISKRITHVQFVSKVARTIGRALGLNEDLIEAIALGHDIGHTPLGHEGETILNEISLRELNEYFSHNIQSVRHLQYVENNGKGLNLTVQVLDGIMCHNGEMLSSTYCPCSKTMDEFLKQYQDAYSDIKKSNRNRPMTLEGCVVRVSDIIGYIGRDIEDAIMIGKIKREDIPNHIVSVLGCTNKEIINTIVLDIIHNSMDQSFIRMSDDVFRALLDLKKFNYEHIYRYSLTDEEREKYRDGMNRIFNRYLDDVLKENKSSVIYQLFLNTQADQYIQSTSPKRMVIDFIAGMTDEMFFREIKKK